MQEGGASVLVDAWSQTSRMPMNEEEAGDDAALWAGVMGDPKDLVAHVTGEGDLVVVVGANLDLQEKHLRSILKVLDFCAIKARRV